MTTSLTITQVCAVCGKEGKHHLVRSSNSNGMDLDLRSQGMVRHTRYGWPLKCDKCGYRFLNLEYAPEGAAELVASDDYRAAVADDRFPESADVWIGTAMVGELAGYPVLAHQAWLEVAWLCDDQGLDEMAAHSRQTSLALLRSALESGSIAEESLALAHVVLADMLRRTGRFEEAREALDVACGTPPHELWSAIIERQAEAIANRDTGAHSVDSGPTIHMQADVTLLSC